MRIRLRDRRTGQTRLISLPQDTANDTNCCPSVSANGRFVLYRSNTPLPGENPADSSYDALLADVRLGATNYAALTSTGTKVSFAVGPDAALSDDGRWVVFDSRADTVVPGDNNRTWDVFIHRR